jgi:hypothetical protein
MKFVSIFLIAILIKNHWQIKCVIGFTELNALQSSLTSVNVVDLSRREEGLDKKKLRKITFKFKLIHIVLYVLKV